MGLRRTTANENAPPLPPGSNTSPELGAGSDFQGRLKKSCYGDRHGVS